MDEAQIYFDGFTFHDGDTHNFYVGCGEAYSVNSVVPAGYAFFGWQASTGSFASPTSSSTTYTAAGTNADIFMAVEDTSTTYANGGYLASAPAGGDFTQVTGTFVLPSVTYTETGKATPPYACPQLPSDTFDLLSLWVGIGTNPLWQAGVDIYRNQTKTYYVEWHEAYGVGGDPNPIYNCNTFPVQGDTIVVTVFSNGAISKSWVNDTSGSPWSWPGTQSWAPNRGYADWTAEVVGMDWPVPSPGTIQFTGCSDSVYGIHMGPLHGQKAEQLAQYPHQYLTPSMITTAGVFSLSYSTG